jgi:hypothetical protein
MGGGYDDGGPGPDDDHSTGHHRADHDAHHRADDDAHHRAGHHNGDPDDRSYPHHLGTHVSR